MGTAPWGEALDTREWAGQLLVREGRHWDPPRVLTTPGFVQNANTQRLMHRAQERSQLC